MVNGKQFVILITTITIIISLINCVPVSRQPEITEDLSDSEMQTDAEWSAKDLRRVANRMANSIESSRFIKSWKYRRVKPRWMLVDQLANDTDEHINTRVIVEKIRTKLINRQLARFIDSHAIDDALNQLDLQQSALYDNRHAIKIGKLVGAKLILRGRISNIRKRSGRRDIVFYNITLTVVDLETTEILWTDEVEISRRHIKQYYRY